ncbi:MULTISPECIES: site-specific integrase [Bacillus cereus group]|uniref:site-specific integrase n=1 Tax=Bacillus cereus group TaxID=86661 RepID=UPI001F174477|nr:site-specific integrase [Bacillus cereus]MDA1521525.1 site-specific integrase [Bacillus cereus]BCC09443.1 DNA integration/recombination/invertion protein [Bacillus cereus]BCC16663.1 DNA integration/recombination/invertion protein [Bacillus cereus]BCC50459.1 DNA integration/recombination/invertion protein [Bacillus cereus]BCD08858.1 DNA integration/recombination/invertion protein [Bacillus cereus]
MTNQTKKQAEIKDVQPIRSLEKIEDMKWSLRKWCGERDYILFLLGINTGLRVSDLLNLKISDVKGKKKITVKEGRTKKTRTIQLNNIYEELNAYIGTLQGTEWLFPSRKEKPISRIQTYRQLNKASEMVDIPDGIGTHTMRKTFGYWYYKRYMNVAKLQMILNHSHPEITLKYIGITDEEIEESLNDFVL